ncbi:hypothetical protein CPB85DRAFT_1231941 [Mucidula mucida]|nr:hypothetical protein CPB85DRAFT_1231941 [Mucidula mucida]
MILTVRTASFEPWAPQLHAHFFASHQTLYKQRPDLAPNFKHSVFPMACFNFACRGRNIICFKHRDVMNIPYGWCAITALGLFDYRKGGHLILWDYGVYFEFPAGTTIYVPSALVVHSNTRLANPDIEERSSFTQYLPGSVLQWIDNGFKSNKQLKADDCARFADIAAWTLDRWTRGLAMMSTWDELKDN